MNQSFLYGIVIVVALLAITMSRLTPETFIIMREPLSQQVIADPIEFARRTITDYASVYDGRDYVF